MVYKTPKKRRQPLQDKSNIDDINLYNDYSESISSPKPMNNLDWRFVDNSRKATQEYSKYNGLGLYTRYKHENYYANVDKNNAQKRTTLYSNDDRSDYSKNNMDVNYDQEVDKYTYEDRNPEMYRNKFISYDNLAQEKNRKNLEKIQNRKIEEEIALQKRRQNDCYDYRYDKCNRDFEIHNDKQLNNVKNKHIKEIRSNKNIEYCEDDKPARYRPYIDNTQVNKNIQKVNKHQNYEDQDFLSVSNDENINHDNFGVKKIAAAKLDEKHANRLASDCVEHERNADIDNTDAKMKNLTINFDIERKISKIKKEMLQQFEKEREQQIIENEKKYKEIEDQVNNKEKETEVLENRYKRSLEKNQELENQIYMKDKEIKEIEKKYNLSTEKNKENAKEIEMLQNKYKKNIERYKEICVKKIKEERKENEKKINKFKTLYDKKIEKYKNYCYALKDKYKKDILRKYAS